MEIKTTKEIQTEGERLFNTDNYNQLDVFDERRWVAINDLIKFLENEFALAGFEYDSNEARLLFGDIKKGLTSNVKKRSK